ncbi:Slp family lipoprotein [Candidatus Fukatsuia symbiotica]|nr:Slp family lipoprotein [Candidatus Fukatsuia symbiotica]MEA9445252.1 Slp family lipoprotein [Candidatus Fukatsuia symbiotica]
MTINVFSNKASFTALTLAVMLLVGCVNVPKVLEGTTRTPQQNLNVIKMTPQAFIGQEARFGGTVVSVVNEPKRTRLEITSVPLDSGAKPILGEASQGRIIAYVNAFLEPVDFQGRLVTVIGSVAGIEKGKIGKVPYDFVVINVNGYKRWYLAEQIVMPPALMDPWGLRGYPNWGWYNNQTAQIQTIVTE